MPQVVTLGTLSGALAAFVFLTLLMFVYRRQNTKALRKPQADRLESWSHVYTALFLTLTPIILSQFVYQLSGSVDNSMFGFLMSGKVSPRKNAFPCLVSTAASTACFPTYRWLWLLPWELP